VFLSLWIQLGAGDVPEHSLRSDFPENRRSYSRALRRGIRDLYTIMLSICEFLENRHKEGRTFVIGLSGIAFTLVP